MQSDFQRLYKYLKKKHKVTQTQIAQILGTKQSVISSCLHKRCRYTGKKFIPDLLHIIDTLEGRRETTQPYCEKCNNAHTHHPEEKDCYS